MLVCVHVLAECGQRSSVLSQANKILSIKGTLHSRTDASVKLVSPSGSNETQCDMLQQPQVPHKDMQSHKKGGCRASEWLYCPQHKHKVLWRKLVLLPVSYKKAEPQQYPFLIFQTDPH